MKVALLSGLLVGLLLATGATARALVDETPGTATATQTEAGIIGSQVGLTETYVEPAVRSAGDLSAQPVAQSALAVVNGLGIVDPNPTCGVPFTVHVNVTNQSRSVSLPGTVTLQNIHRGTGDVNYTGYGNYPSMEPGGNYVVPFTVLINSYISEGQELTAFTNGTTNKLKYDIDRGSCSKTSSSSPSTPSTGQSFVVRHSGKCMDVPGGSQNSITTIQQFSCTGGSNQQWSAQSIGNGFYQIVSLFSGMCLNVDGFSQQANALVQQYPCNGADNQSFTFRNVSGGYNLIIARHSGMCLDVSGSST